MSHSLCVALHDAISVPVQSGGRRFGAPPLVRLIRVSHLAQLILGK
jgi:hypothetical protein